MYVFEKETNVFKKEIVVQMSLIDEDNYESSQDEG